MKPAAWSARRARARKAAMSSGTRSEGIAKRDIEIYTFSVPQAVGRGRDVDTIAPGGLGSVERRIGIENGSTRIA